MAIDVDKLEREIALEKARQAKELESGTKTRASITEGWKPGPLIFAGVVLVIFLLLTVYVLFV